MSIPNRKTLIKDFEELKNYVHVAKKYNVSDVAVKKWVLKYDMEDIVIEIRNRQETR